MHLLQQNFTQKKVAQISINNQCVERSVSLLKEHLPLKDASSSTFYNLQHIIKPLIGRIVQCLALLKNIKPSQRVCFHKDLPISRTICKRNNRGSFEDGKIPFPMKKIRTINVVLTYKRRKAKCNMAFKLS